MKKIYSFLFVLAALVSEAQTICSSSGNLMIFTNYDGGTLTINVDQNVSNLKIGICSYAACQVNLTGSFLSNVTEVHYAGYNGPNTSCSSSSSISATIINGAPSSAITSISFAPTATLSNSNGYGSIICGYSCSNNTNQGGCNTVDQIEGYFLGYFSGSSLYAHKVQYSCWTGTQSLSIGGNCCPPPPIYAGSVTASQTICAGQTPNPFLSSASATVGAGTISYEWQSSTSSSNSGFTTIPAATSSTYAAGTLSQTTYYRRAASSSTSNVGYSNVITVNVLPLTIVSISGATNVCAGSTTTLSATGGTSYLWSPGGATTYSTALTPAVSSIISLTCFPSNGCSVTANFPIVVNPVPVIIASSSNPNSLCAVQTATLTGNGAATFTWNPGNLTGSSVTVSPSSSTVYTLTGKDPNGCVAMTLLSLNVDPLPVIAVLTNPLLVCDGNPNVLTGSGATSYTWMPGSIISSSIVVIPTVTTVYTLTGNDGVCSASLTLTLAPLPSPTVVIGSTGQSFCKGESTFITVGGAVSYTLQNSNTVITSNSIVVSPTVTTNFTVTGTGSNGCSRSAVQTIAVSKCTDIVNQTLIKELGLKLYPNPNTGEFFVEGKAATSLDLINNAGQLIRHIDLTLKNDYKVSVSGLPAGIYFIRNDEGFRQKIIVTAGN